MPSSLFARTHLVNGAGAAFLLAFSLPRPSFVGQVSHVIATAIIVSLSVAALEWKLREAFATFLRWSAVAVPLGIVSGGFLDVESLVLPSIIGTLVAVVCSSGRAISAIPADDSQQRSWCLAGWDAVLALALAALYRYHAVALWAPLTAACGGLVMAIRGGRLPGQTILLNLRRGAGWASVAVAMGSLFMSPFIFLALAGKHDGPARMSFDSARTPSTLPIGTSSGVYPARVRVGRTYRGGFSLCQVL